MPASSSPFVSFILPSYNEGDKLRLTVESLCANTLEPFEIVVVDNGSTDASSDFLQGTGPHDPVRLWRSPHPLGVVGARHAGAQVARGEVLAFCDAHMLFPHGWLTPLLAELTLGVGMVGPSLCQWGDLDGPVCRGSTWKDASLALTDFEFDGHAPTDVPILGGACQLMRRELFESVGGYDSGMVDWGSEDQELCFRLWTLGFRVRVVPSVLVQHYYRAAEPYPRPHVTYNKLRTVFTHFSPVRVTACAAAMASEPGFAQAMERMDGSDVWDRRAGLERRIVRVDEELFSRFRIAF